MIDVIQVMESFLTVTHPLDKTSIECLLCDRMAEILYSKKPDSAAENTEHNKLIKIQYGTREGLMLPESSAHRK